MKWEIFIKIILFIFCLVIAHFCFDFKAQYVAICLGVFQFFSSIFEMTKRNQIEGEKIENIKQLNLDHSNLISKEKQKHISLHKLIIKDNNKTINKIVTHINSTFPSITIEQQKSVLESLVNEIDQQVTYTINLCDQYIGSTEYDECIQPLNQFKWSIVKQIQGKKARKGINFDSLLKQLQNLEDKINV